MKTLSVVLGGVMLALGFSACSDDDPVLGPVDAGPGLDASRPDGQVAIQPDGGGGAIDSGGQDSGRNEGDASAPDGGDGGGAADASDGAVPEVIGAHVNCSTGKDTGAGTSADPLRTLAKAASVAAAGTTILVQDGECTPASEPAFNTASGKVTLPDGVSLRAEHAGAVTFRGVDGYRSAGIELAGSGRVAGVRFHLFGHAIIAKAGTVVVEGVSFDDVHQGFPIRAQGTARVTVLPGGLTNYVGDNQRNFAEVVATAELTILGGTIRGAKDSGISGAGQLMIRDSGRLVLDGVTLVDSTHSGIVLMNAATAVLRNTVIDNVGSTACCNATAVGLSDTSQVTMTDVSIVRSPAYGIQARGGTPTIDLTRVTIENGRTAAIVAQVYSEARPIVRMVNSHVRNNRQGLHFNYAVDLTMTESSVIDTGHPTLGCSPGVRVTGGVEANKVRLRNTTIRRSCLAGLEVAGAENSVVDLGTKASPGGNTFAENNLSNNPSTASLWLKPAAGYTVHAVGNTWAPGEQGAAPADSTDPPPGRYVVETGTVREVTGPVSGKNFVISGNAASTTVLRLAEK